MPITPAGHKTVTRLDDFTIACLMFPQFVEMMKNGTTNYKHLLDQLSGMTGDIKTARTNL